MPLLEEIEFKIDVDHVLRAQGADPDIIRGRSPHLVEVAKDALQLGHPLLEPKILYEKLKTDSIKHETLRFENGGSIRGNLIAQHLAPAEEVIVILCTVGSPLEERSIELVKTDPVAGLALEGVGSAGVEAIANAACYHFEKMAEEEGWNATIPLSPGMTGWSVDKGQPEIFSLLNAKEIDVTLTPSYLMLPRKSLSMVIGIGENIRADGTTCDYCSMKETCQYQDHYTASVNT
jgi:hypothetical protein